MRKRSFLAAAGVSLLAVALAAPQAAYADPPTPRVLSVVGSITTEKVMTAFQGIIPTLGNYEGSLTGTITTKNGTTCAGLARPAGSGAGVDALVAQRDAAAAAVPPRASCFDVSRSSDDLRARASVQGKDLVQVPFAVDTVTMATRDDSPLASNFTVAFLTALYNCTLPAAVQSQYRPLLPQAGSGTRNFFLNRIGVTATSLGSGCAVGTAGRYSDVTATGAPILENNGTFFTDARNIGPYSISDYRFQSATAGPAGRVQMREVAGQLADHTNSAFPWHRWVYNVVPGQFVRSNDANYAPVFFGTGSTICTRTDIIAGNAFGAIPAGGGTDSNGVTITGCGDTASVVIPGTVTTAPPSDTV